MADVVETDCRKVVMRRCMVCEFFPTHLEYHMTIGKTKKRVLRTAYNYDAKAASTETGQVAGDEPSKAVQSEKDNCDINIIVKRFGITNRMPQSVRIPSYGDFTSVIDFHSAMDAIRVAEEGFMSLPSVVRNRFNNDPQEFLEFCQVEENLPELRKMGLAIPQVDVIIPPPVKKEEIVPPINEEKPSGGDQAK